MKWNKTYTAGDVLHLGELQNVILFFCLASFCGWVWEVLVYWLQHSPQYTLLELVLSYRGVLHGPWVPIYGTGAVIMVWIRQRITKGPLCFFAVCMGACGVVEYLASWGLEILFHARWWDYTGFFLNVNGRICAMSLVVFAAAGAAVGDWIAPFIWKQFNSIEQKYRTWAGILIAAAFLADVAISFCLPNTGLGVTSVR